MPRNFLKIRPSGIAAGLLAAALLAAGLLGPGWILPPEAAPAPPPGAVGAGAAGAGAVAPAESAARRAFEGERSGVWLRAKGEVARILRDDREGRRHQRFILRLTDGQTLLISHNIGLAPRVPVRIGDEAEVFGRYEWNPRGGVVHWTHRDPAGRKAGGWIRHAGIEYR